MITGPFLDLTFLCFMVIGGGVGAAIFIVTLLSYYQIKHKRVTYSKNSKR